MYKFHDPHPGGIQGCTKSLPKGVKHVIDSMSGNIMSIEVALIRLRMLLTGEKSTIKGMEINSYDNVDKSGSICLKEFCQDGGYYSWKLIEYSENTVMNEKNESKNTILTRNDPIVFHFRLGKGKTIEPKAGATVVFLPDKKRFGIALCNEKDRFYKKHGIRVATRRAEMGEKYINKGQQPRRFDSAPAYMGELNFEDVKFAAKNLALDAAKVVGNPVY